MCSSYSMPQDPLLTQLAERCRTFSAGTGISLNKIAKMVGVETTNFSTFINGRCGLSAKATIKLLRVLNLSRREVEMKLSARNVQIKHLQRDGALMHLDNDGWVAGVGTDPVDSGDITTPKAGGDPSGDDLIDVLHQVDNFHKQAREGLRATSPLPKKLKLMMGQLLHPRKLLTSARLGQGVICFV
jgi:plasmid maintenance system antidote protein VapI